MSSSSEAKLFDKVTSLKALASLPTRSRRKRKVFTEVTSIVSVSVAPNEASTALRAVRISTLSGPSHDAGDRDGEIDPVHTDLGHEKPRKRPATRTQTCPKHVFPNVYVVAISDRRSLKCLCRALIP